MDVFKEYAHIFLTTVLLISSFSTFAVAVCTLPTELHNAVWNYQYTDHSNNAQTTTLTFGITTLTRPSNIRLNALGTILNAWTCISNLTLSSDVSVAVFKSDESYTDFGGNTKWVYLCMKLTKVADDFFYFYLLSDEDSSLFPAERVYQSISIQDNTVPVCSTFCQYTSQPKIRTLKKSGSSTTLPGDISLCEPCDSSCEEGTTKMTSLKTTQNTRLAFTSSEIEISTGTTTKETSQKTMAQSNSTEMVTAIEMTPQEITQKTTAQSASTEMVTTTDTTPLKTTQQTTAQSASTEMATATEMTPLETTHKTTTQSTSNEMVTTTEMALYETTLKTTAQFTSIEMVTTPEMTPLETSQKTTAQPTSTEMVTTPVMTPLVTTQKTTAQPTSTEMVSTTEMTPLETTQTTTAQSIFSEMDITTEENIMVDVTETNSDINQVNKDVKDKSIMDTQFTVTETLMIIIGSIVLPAIAGFLIVIIVYRKGHSGVDTIENTQEKGEDAYGITPQICYLYKGKDFGFQKIAIRHWDCH